jgi:hypothetical protein
VSIRITCPSCAASMTVPESAAGKTGKCPKCKASIVIPSVPSKLKVVDEPAESQRRKQDMDDDADDRPFRRREQSNVDDDSDNRLARRPKTKRKKQSKKQAGGGKMLILAAVGVAVGIAVLVGGGIAAWLLLRTRDAPSGITRIDPAGAAPQGQNTAEWKRVDGPDGIFTAYFPGGSSAAVDLVEKAADKFGPRTQKWTQHFNDRSYIATLMTWEPQFAGAAEPDVVARVRGNNAYTAEALTTLGGRKALRFITLSGKVCQTVVTAGLGNGRSVNFTVLGDAGLTFEDPMVEQFFAKIELKGGSIPPPAAAPGEWPSQTLSFKTLSVSVSAPATLQSATPSGIPPKGVSQRMWQAQMQGDKSMVYTLIIISMEQPPAQGVDLDQLCDGFVKHMNFGAEKTRAPVTLDGRLGRKMVFSSGGRDIYYQATVVGSEVVTLTAAGRTPLSEDDPAIAKFFNSVKIKK